MPSIRTVSKEYGVIKKTVIQAYLSKLESRSCIVSRPQAGPLFVCVKAYLRLPVPHASQSQ